MSARFFASGYQCSLLFLLLLVNATGFAQEKVSIADQAAIRGIIQSQLDAFQADDAERAFSFASPDIQAQFGSPANFMAMVKTGYQPVYRPRSVVFQDIVRYNKLVAQQVLLMDIEGKSVLAVYPMEQQADGSWRIAGCYLRPSSKAQLL